MNSLRIVDAPLDRLEAEVTASLFFDDARPLSGSAGLLDWRLNGRLTGLLLSGASVGRAGEQVLIRSNGKIASPWVLFVGGGSWHGLAGETLRNVVRHLANTCVAPGFRRIALGLEPPEGFPSEALVPLVNSALVEFQGDRQWLLASQECSMKPAVNG